MKKTFKKYGELKYIPADEWMELNFNPYFSMEGYDRASDGTVAEVWTCGNYAKKYHIPQFVATQP